MDNDKTLKVKTLKRLISLLQSLGLKLTSPSSTSDPEKSPASLCAAAPKVSAETQTTQTDAATGSEDVPGAWWMDPGGAGRPGPSARHRLGESAQSAAAAPAAPSEGRHRQDHPLPQGGGEREY